MKLTGLEISLWTKQWMRSTSHPDTVIQGDSKVDLNFRPRVYGCAPLFYINHIITTIMQIRNLVSFLLVKIGEDEDIF